MSNLQDFGFIGLGRMGANMVNRLLSQTKDLTPIIWNRDQSKMAPLIKKGAIGPSSFDNLLSKIKSKQKIIWLMLPAGEVTENAFKYFLENLNADDVIIDGANSNFHDTLKRHSLAKEKGIKMLDVGVSGGIVAKDTGYPMMVGGEKDTYELCLPIFEAIGIKEGFDLVGKGGAGHYVKMIHNAIEYGMMQAIGEGFDLLKQGRFENLNLHNISSIWNRGTIVSSFLMKMMEQALNKDKKLSYLKPYIDDSGEGKWSAIEALEYNVPFTVNSYALNARFTSRDSNSFAMKAVAAIRNEFGGHPFKK